MLRTERLSLCVGAFCLKEITLQIGSGEYFVLLGPNGSGKTLFISCVCGLIRADSGSILIDGRDVTNLEPRLRGIGYVPQDLGLFPHLNVRKNLTFGQRALGLSGPEDRTRIDALIAVLGLEPLLSRWPTTLSGGERQKVALGRALASHPKVLLLDEPVSALDGPTRQQMCVELRRVQREFNIATVHVCHSIDEAVSVSDRSGVFIDGRLVQSGTMNDLLLSPRDEAVARLLGAENIFTGVARLDGDGSALSFGPHEVRIAGRREGKVAFLVRAERLIVREEKGVRHLLCEAPSGPTGKRCLTPFSSSIRAKLVRVENRGPYVRTEFDAGVSLVVYHHPTDLPGALAVGGEYALEFPPDAVYVFPE